MAGKESGAGRGGHDINPVQVQKYLGGVDYPASRRDLVERAKQQDAPQDVVELLQRLPDRSYDEPTDVTKAVADRQ